MAGKVTFLRGPHESRKGKWLQSFDIPNRSRKEIESALGRILLKGEAAGIEHMVCVYRYLRGLNDNGVTDMQSVKRTLAAFANLPNEAAQNAYCDCDTNSRAYIQHALYFDLAARGENLTHPAGDLIKKAAEEAASKLPKINGRREKGWQRLLAKQILILWCQLGGRPEKSWAADGRMSALNSFAVALFTLVGGYPFDPTSTAKLLRDAAKQIGETHR